MRKHSRLEKHTFGDVAFDILNYTFFTLFTLCCIYPFYYLFINTISANNLSENGFIRFFPKELHLENYKEILKMRGISLATVVSIGRTSLGTVGTVFASAFLGFMFTQQKMWKRKIWYRFLVITMYFNAGLIPMYMTMKTLSLTNNFLVYIIPTIVSPFYIILAKTFIESIDSPLQEAAEIDGAGVFTVFYKIILPVCKPILATIAIFSAVNQWNSFSDTLIYVTNQKLYTLQYLLYTFLNQANSLAALVKASNGGSSLDMASLVTQQTPTSIRMTITIVIVSPILLVYPIFQKYFVKGIMMGSIKG